jgi:succinyl-diaminopimelate desuccinylase
MSDDSRDAVLTAAKALISRPSENPPGNERSVAEWLESRLVESSVSFTVETNEVLSNRPNVIARVGDPQHGSVLLTGHMDVVPVDRTEWTNDPYDPVVRDGRLYGRGAADMKGALAAMLISTERYVKSTETPGEVVLAFVVDEEHRGAGTQALIEDGIATDAAVIGEPTDLNISTAIKGVVRYEATVSGESCHSGQPDKGRDAIAGLRELLDRVAALDADLESTSHDILAHEDVTVTQVSGGLAPNVVADHATATIDWRFLPGTTEADPFDQRIRETLTNLAVANTAFDVDLDRSVFARAGETDGDHPFVSTVVDAAHKTGVAADLVGFNAATDARFLIQDADIPTVHFGPGSLTDDAHTVDESVAIDDLVATVDVYETLLNRFL